MARYSWLPPSFISVSASVIAAVTLSVLAIANSQIDIQQFSSTPETFFDAIFEKVEGVTDLSVQLIGAPEAFGLFSSGSSSINLGSGVMLSSGFVLNALGPNSETDSTGVNSQPGDPDLAGISDSGISVDAAVVVIEFMATEPVIFSITYVFASEEYNEFLQFEDPFGFFVDGVNVARAADGRPVTVSTINCGPTGNDQLGPNCDQFVNNEGGAFFIEFDGFTTALTATSQELGVGLHTIKLAVSDEADLVLDTAVFIQDNAVIAPVDEFFATIKSDPHIQGFHGQQFDFKGQPGNDYAFLSCPGLQMNVHLEEAYISGLAVQPEIDEMEPGRDGNGYMLLPFQKRGTWVTEAGFIIQTTEGDDVHTIVIRALPAANMGSKSISVGTIVVDEKLGIVTMGDYEVAPGISLRITNSKSFTRITVATDMHTFKAIVDIVPPSWEEIETESNKAFDFEKLWHLNVQVYGLAGQVNAHGVIGQTVYSRKGALEGEERDYVVRDGLLGHDFVFDKFSTPFELRRMLEQAPAGGRKPGSGIPHITPNELQVLLDLDMSMSGLTEITNEDFSSVFHTDSRATKAVLNAGTLAKAVERITAAQSSPFDEILSFKEAMYLEQTTRGNMTSTMSGALERRDSLQRVSTALYFNKNL